MKNDIKTFRKLLSRGIRERFERVRLDEIFRKMRLIEIIEYTIVLLVGIMLLFKSIEMSAFEVITISFLFVIWYGLQSIKRELVKIV